MMGIGFCIMLISLLIHFLAIKRVDKLYGASYTSCGDSGISFGFICACFEVVIRASSFLSNSYILEEGKVANFLLATTGIVKLRYSIMTKKMLLEAVVLLLLVTFCRFSIEVELSKQAATSQFLNVYASWMTSIASGLPAWTFIAEFVPLLMLILLAFLLYKTISSCSCKGYCIMRLDNIEQEDAKDGIRDVLAVDPLSVTQWNLLAVCLFFCSGHWCAFDGLRYGAAFIGFDEFILIRQAILLTIDTFGFSHILPIFGLPFLVACQYSLNKKRFILVRLSQVYMMYGLITAATVTVTMLCVTIHRRHLMVWGLFAPKFVFDVVGLILSDVLICLASLFSFGQVEDDALQNQVLRSEK